MVNLTLCEGELPVSSSQSNQTDEFPMPTLPHLVTLEATPDYIVRLLEPHDVVQVKLPRLKNIGIEPFHHGHEPATVYNTIHQAFNVINIAFASSPERRIRLSLTMYGNSDFADWLAVVEGQVRPEQLLQCVDCLELRTDVLPALSNEVMRLVYGWVAFFPAVEDVVFTGGFLSDISVESQVTLVRQLHHACPRVQTVEILCKKERKQVHKKLRVQEWLTGGIGAGAGNGS